MRHRGKIEAAIHNARCAVRLEAERGSFGRVLLRGLEADPATAGRRRRRATTSPESVALSKDPEARLEVRRADHPVRLHTGDGLVNDHASGRVRDRRTRVAQARKRLPRADLRRRPGLAISRSAADSSISRTSARPVAFGDGLVAVAPLHRGS